MTIKPSGSTLTFTDIYTEFGLPPERNLGAYRVSQTVSGLSNIPLDTDIPKSGTIKFSDFYNKKLNIVVDCTPAPNTVATKVNAKSNYTSNISVTYIGNFASKPDSTANKKVIIHNNGTIGSDKKSAGTTYCSLLTGNWGTETDLVIDIGSSGGVYGAGGDGGNGSNAVRENSWNSISAPTIGGNGTSAIGIIATNNTIINNRGTISCGAGGGGGGGGATVRTQQKGQDDNSACGGGGGGGGVGYPGGSGGKGGTARQVEKGEALAGYDGAGGSLESGGAGGNGRHTGSGGECTSGGGGGGGFAGLAGEQGTSNQGTKGTDGSLNSGGKGGNGYSEDSETTNGVNGGASGYAVVSTGGAITVPGTVIGDKLFNASGDNAPK
jgi:hypothetical protein